MSDVLAHKPMEFTLPIVRTEIEEEDEYPDPPLPPIEPIHALQLFFLPFLLFYLFISVVISIGLGHYGLLAICSLSILVLIVGRELEKKYQKDPVLRRKIAIGVLGVEVVLFALWQNVCRFIFS